MKIRVSLEDYPPFWKTEIEIEHGTDLKGVIDDIMDLEFQGERKLSSHLERTLPKDLVLERVNPFDSSNPPQYKFPTAYLDGERRFVAPRTEHGAYTFRWVGSEELYFVRKKRTREVRELVITLVCQGASDHEFLENMKRGVRKYGHTNPPQINEKYIKHEHWIHAP